MQSRVPPIRLVFATKEKLYSYHFLKLLYLYSINRLFMQPTALIRPLRELLLRYLNHSNHYGWIKFIYISNQRLLKLLLPLKPHRQQATRVEVVVTVGVDTVEEALAAVANTDQDVLIFTWRVVGLCALLHFHYWLMEVFYFSIKKKIKNSNNKDIHLPLC